MKNSLLAMLLLIPLLLHPVALRAEVGDPTLRTDHPHYAGEGAFQTIDDVVDFATAGKEDPQEQAIAMFLWLLTHQFHLASPQEPYVAGLVPDNATMQEDLTVYDANRARFSYAYGLCGTVHAWNEPYWEALGMRARRRAFPGHVNSEIFYDGGWHAFDTDMAGLILREDGVVAGYEDIKKDPTLVKQSHSPLPCYPFAWPGDFQVMQKGWQEVAAGGEWFELYHGGYAAHPPIVQLRSGESFTRWFNPDHFGGESKRRFWHHQKNGPFRNWTFVNQGTPYHDGDKANARGNASYCNGVFRYEPLKGSDWREGLVSTSGELVLQESSPRLHSPDGQPTTAIFSHFSPYVIAGDPVDDANPMSAKATDGLVVSGKAVGKVVLELSVDQGQSWLPARTLSGTFREDLTEQAKGRYGWWIRLSWSGKAGLDELLLETTTQVAQPIYPRLTPEGCEVTYRVANRCVWPLLPNFALNEQDLSALEVQSMRSSNVQYQPRSPENRLAYTVRNNQPGVIVFRIDAPASLVGISAAARFAVRSPSPEGCDFHMDVSLDDGMNWQRLGQADVPLDNEFSSGWLDGRLELQQPSSRTALVRVHLYGGGYPTGLIDAQLYGLYQTGPSQAVRLSYGWTEEGELRSHEEAIPAGVREHVFHVPTGSEIRDEFVRMDVR